MRRRRTQLGLTAQGVADRTAELGYPISRGTLAKLESSQRGGKVEIAELLVLAEALEVSPAALLWFDAADGKAEVFPGVTVSSGEAFQWFTGEGSRGLMHDASGVFDSLVAASSLRRLMQTRTAVRIAEIRGAGGNTEQQQTLSELLPKLAQVEMNAIGDGWTVNRTTDG